jgi:hypothetical protein
MKVTVKIPDEIAAEAKARRMRVDAYIEEISPSGQERRLLLAARGPPLRSEFGLIL